MDYTVRLSERLERIDNTWVDQILKYWLITWSVSCIQILSEIFSVNLIVVGFSIYMNFFISTPTTIYWFPAEIILDKAKICIFADLLYKFTFLPIYRDIAPRSFQIKNIILLHKAHLHV